MVEELQVPRVDIHLGHRARTVHYGGVQDAAGH
jgi:hypothetical protein